MSHTKGPWSLSLIGFSVFICAGPDEAIAEMIALTPDDGVMADARLISAAPDMYVALEKLANEASGFLGCSDVERHGMTNSRILRDRIEQARDCLKKARGEQ